MTARPFTLGEYLSQMKRRHLHPLRSFQKSGTNEYAHIDLFPRIVFRIVIINTLPTVLVVDSEGAVRVVAIMNSHKEKRPVNEILKILRSITATRTTH